MSVPYRNYIYEYQDKIRSGQIVAGKWIKAIYQILVDGLKRQEYFFNEKDANKAINFIENFCHHSKGRNDLIKLELWQKAMVSAIFGIGTRSITSAMRRAAFGSDFWAAVFDSSFFRLDCSLFHRKAFGT